MRLLPQKRCKNKSCQVHIWSTATVCWNCGAQQEKVVAFEGLDSQKKQ